MAIRSAALSRINAGPAGLRLYFRTVHIPFEGSPDPLRVVPWSGRWPTDHTLYTAESAEVAWAEYCRNHAADVEAADLTGGVGLDLSALRALGEFGLGPPVPSRSFFELRFEFTKLADLTSRTSWVSLATAGFDIGDFYSDDYGACEEISRYAVSRGWEAIRVPSAGWRSADAFCVPVFRNGLRRLKSARELVSAAVPSVRIAVGTSYRSDERPSWMLGV
jgi:hypothetical protein